jgi:hypothetical protein
VRLCLRQSRTIGLLFDATSNPYATKNNLHKQQLFNACLLSIDPQHPELGKRTVLFDSDKNIANRKKLTPTTENRF